VSPVRATKLPVVAAVGEVVRAFTPFENAFAGNAEPVAELEPTVHVADWDAATLLEISLGDPVKSARVARVVPVPVTLHLTRIYLE